MNAHHTYIGTTGYGSEGVWATREDRFAHIALLGASGSGKSFAMREIAAADIARGDGVLYLEPHGDDVAFLLDRVPPWRHNQVVLLDFASLEYPVAFNVLECRHADHRARIADALISGLRDIWAGSWGPRLELVLRHATHALLEVPDSTIVHIGRLLTDDAFRTRVTARLSNPITRNFFTDRFDEWRSAYRTEAIEPVLTRLDAFLSFPAILQCLGQHRRTLSLEDAMDSQRVILINLARGVLGDTGANLMGILLFARARTAAMARARLPRETRRPFHIFIDEAQTMTTEAIPAALAELRKFEASVLLASQTLSGLSDRTRGAILGAVGTVGAFRIGPEDGELIARRFADLHREFNAGVFNELATGEMFIKIAGRDVRRVSTPPASPAFGTADIVQRQARRHYARPRAEVEAWLKRSFDLGSAEKRRRAH